MIKKFVLLLLLPLSVFAESVLVEAENFKNTGGWGVDTQFIQNMGSPYLIAHGLGEAVADATTEVSVKTSGEYRVWVRTKDWVAHWNAPGTPGHFKLAVNGNDLEADFGTVGAKWHWQNGGTVKLNTGKNSLILKDQKGFNARCDAIYLTSDLSEKPDNSSEMLSDWRREKLGINARINEKKYDLVVIGGGYGGMGAAIAAARMGVKVALIQNRDVLGGNGSSECQVWSMGNFPKSEYNLGDIVKEFKEKASASPSKIEEYQDPKKEKIVLAEKNIDLFLGHHAFAVKKNGDAIASVDAMNVRSNEIVRFTAPLFCDSTGHGFIAQWAGAEGEMKDGGRMGMSNMWAWENTKSEQSFPETPWALTLTEKGFPYPRKFHAQWFWESGYDKHPINDLELIRDWNLRANFGAWNAIKNKNAYTKYDKTGKSHKNARIRWMAYVGGTRETQQFFGDVIVEEKDVVSKRVYPDSCVLATWSIDLHYPKKQYIGNFEANPFISYAVHGKGVDRKKGYAFPYRSFYSRNVPNLFIACRALSVTHEALGTIRVMNTLGMVGVAVGRASHLAIKHGTTPRGVYDKHLDELKELWRQPGKTRLEIKK
ncbi:MAG: FAD-dependent oxidoreductase [Lentisphaeraceae bacterium]|nr:FAD-dependent oxidoreductase [Lentisphaeraceae bacterium]